jgi:hypothetical protein
MFKMRDIGHSRLVSSIAGRGKDDQQRGNHYSHSESHDSKLPCCFPRKTITAAQMRGQFNALQLNSIFFLQELEPRKALIPLKGG